jgi:MFS family permease
MYLLGTFLQSITTLGCGLAKTSTQMIVFRALAGVSISFCLPAAVSLIMAYFAVGPRRNFAFGVMGGGQPLGFTIGLTAGGGLTESLGWQSGFYMIAGLNTVLFFLALFGLPRIPRSAPVTFSRLRDEVDWIGALILTSSIALLLYVFA